MIEFDATFDVKDYRQVNRRQCIKLAQMMTISIICLIVFFLLEHFVIKEYFITILFGALIGLFCLLIPILIAVGYKKGLERAKQGGASILNVKLDDDFVLEEYQHGEMTSKLTCGFGDIKLVELVGDILAIRFGLIQYPLCISEMPIEQLNEIKTLFCRRLPRKKVKMNIEKFVKYRQKHVSQ